MQDYFNKFQVVSTLHFAVAKEKLFALWTEENQAEMLIFLFWFLQPEGDFESWSLSYEYMVESCKGFDFITYSINRGYESRLLQEVMSLAEPEYLVNCDQYLYSPQLENPIPRDAVGNKIYVNFCNHLYKGYMRFHAGEGDQQYMFNKVTLPKGALHT